MSNYLFPISGVGSLPHPCTDSALGHVFKYDLPFAPQLPARDTRESMIFQTLDGIGNIELLSGGEVIIHEIYPSEKQNFSQDRQSYQALTPFLFEIHNQKSTQIKLQFTGVFTLFQYAKYTNKNRKFFNQIEAFLLKKIEHTIMQCVDTTVFLQIDEPALFALHGEKNINMFNHFISKLLKLKSPTVKVGLHCCSNTNWEFIFAHPIDFISVDCRLSLKSILKKNQHLLKISSLFLGVIPTLPTIKVHDFDVSRSCHNLLKELTNSFSKDELHQILDNIFLTPACGLGQKRIAESEEYLDKLIEYQQTLRKLIKKRS